MKLNRKRVGIILVVIGLLLAIGVGAVVYMQTEQAAEIARRTPVTDVVVAITDLPERSPVPASAVKVIKVPVDLAAPQAAAKPEDVVGKYPLSRIYVGEVVLRPKLAATAGQTVPSYTLEEGMVAATLAGSDLLNGTGAIRAGDRVDMLVSLPLPPPAETAGGGNISTSGGTTQVIPSVPLVSQKMLQNLEVMRVGNFPGAGETAAQGTGKAVTFQVTHQDSLILKWAKDSGGVIDLILRHPEDREPVDTEAIDMSYVFQTFNFKFAESLEAPAQ